MNRHEQQRLLNEIAFIAEKAYRRGFQHGHSAALGETGSAPPGKSDVYEWRFAEHSKTHSVYPPGTMDAGRREKQAERLEIELEDQDMIQELLWNCRSSA